MLVPHFIENIFCSRLTLDSSNVIITIKIDVKKPQEYKQTKNIILKKLNGLTNNKLPLNKGQYIELNILTAWLCTKVHLQCYPQRMKL